MVVCYHTLSKSNNFLKYAVNIISETKSGIDAAAMENSVFVGADGKKSDPKVAENITAFTQSIAAKTTEDPTSVENNINSRTVKMTSQLSTKAADLASTAPSTTTKATKTIYKKFAICHSYWEQQTNAVLNMWSFQKWAKKSGNYGVVEPFVHDSVLGFSEQNIIQRNFDTSLCFRDYFDLDQWNKGTEKYSIPPLVNWDEFVEHASRDIVLAVMVNSRPEGIFIGDDIKKNSQCRREIETFKPIVESLLGNLEFKVVKIVCYSILKTYSLEEFNSPFDPNNNGTVFFTKWTGIGRVKINDESLHRYQEPEMLSKILPNARIMSDSRNYVKHVLNADFSGYTAIVFRAIRRTQEMNFNGFQKTQILQHFYECIEELPNITKHYGLKSFLATDLGRFGDQTNKNSRNPMFLKLFQHLINMVYGNKTVSEYEEDFVTAANGISDTGYIGTIQKAISLKAKCIVVIGGFSTFQDSLIAEFKENSHCITLLCYGKPLPPKKPSPPKEYFL